MSLRTVILLGVLLSGASLGWLYLTIHHAQVAQQRVEQAVQDEIHFTTTWPADAMTDSPWLQSFGGFNPIVTTNWYQDDSGAGQMHYGVELDPANPPKPGALAQVLAQCRFSLEVDDPQGSVIATLPLTLGLSPSRSLREPVLAASANLRMSAAAYAALTGANGTPNPGATGATHLADVCPNTPPPAPSLLH